MNIHNLVTNTSDGELLDKNVEKPPFVSKSTTNHLFKG